MTRDTEQKLADLNQPPLWSGINAYRSDPLLVDATDAMPKGLRDEFDAIGRYVTSPEAQELARMANEGVPQLRTHGPRGERIEAVGFNDLDAFSDNDMYAVGGHGDVWHFDGNTWTQMAFPSNMQLATVTCAGDGKVYVSGEGGSLWVGQRSTWELLYEGSSSVLWNDVLWFDGRLWLASDYQLRTLNGRTLAAVEHEGEAVPAFGHMDARDGLLAVASPWSVMTFDGKTWRTIVAPYND